MLVGFSEGTTGAERLVREEWPVGRVQLLPALLGRVDFTDGQTQLYEGGSNAELLVRVEEPSGGGIDSSRRKGAERMVAWNGPIGRTR